MREVLIRSPSVAFAFGINASQFRAVPGGPSAVRASRYGGTGAMTTPASPATVVDRSHGISVSCPTAFRTDIAAICRLVAMEARRAYLAGMGWVYPFHDPAQSLG